MKTFFERHFYKILFLVLFVSGCVTSGNTSFTYTTPDKTITYERDGDKVISQYEGPDRSWSLEKTLEVLERDHEELFGEEN